MTAHECEVLAIQKFGPNVYVFDRDHTCGRIPRYYVGCGSYLYGNGHTWEEALEACERSLALAVPGVCIGCNKRIMMRAGTVPVHCRRCAEEATPRMKSEAYDA